MKKLRFDYHNRKGIVSHFKSGAFLRVVFYNFGVSFVKNGFAHP